MGGGGGGGSDCKKGGGKIGTVSLLRGLRVGIASSS